jgi:hypothetical protein
LEVEREGRRRGLEKRSSRIEKMVGGERPGLGTCLTELDTMAWG